MAEKLNPKLMKQLIAQWANMGPAGQRLATELYGPIQPALPFEIEDLGPDNTFVPNEPTKEQWDDEMRYQRELELRAAEDYPFPPEELPRTKQSPVGKSSQISSASKLPTRAQRMMAGDYMNYGGPNELSLEQRMNLPVKENADLRTNQQRMAEFGGGPVKAENKISNLVETVKPWTKANSRVTMGDITNPELLRRGRGARKAPSFREVFGGAKNPNILGPVGKLPMIGALPLPSTVQDTAIDLQSPLLSNREKMLRFLLRGAVPVASPVEEYMAKGGI